MNTLEKLIAKLCPDGVEYKPLGEACVLQRGERITKSELIVNGDFEVISGGLGALGRYDKFNRPAGTITIAQYGTAGYVAWRDKKFWANDVCYSIMPNSTQKASVRYLFYMLKAFQNLIYSKVRRDAVPSHLPREAVEDLEIPLPPLPVQQEIVRMLDEMSGLVDALEEELTARKKQYEWCRRKMLTMYENDGGVSLQHEFPKARKVRLGTLIDEGIINMTRGDYITKKDALPGDIPVILGGQEPAYFINRFNHTGRGIVISRSGASAGFVSFWNEPIFITDGFAFDCDERSLNVRYLFHLLKQHQQNLNRMKKGGGVPHITGENLKALDISLPPIAEQNRIVKILDSFDTLCNSITDGLPGEIALRKQQYEYYRDKLLTFQRKETA